MPKPEDTIKTRIEITGEKEYKSAIKDINSNIKLMGSEMKLAAAQFADNAKSVDALKARQEILNQTYEEQVQKVKAAEQMLSIYQQQGEKGADAARKMQIELNGFATAAAKTQNEIKRVNKELDDAEKALNDVDGETDQAANGLKDVGTESEKAAEKLKKTEKETKEAGEGFSKFGEMAGKAGQAIKTAALGIGAAVAGIGAAVVGLVEGTRETREEFNKLEAAFTSAGHTAQTAEKTYNSFYALLGDEGQATEAVSHLAKMTDNQKELTEWTNIATGVFATFGDSLPIENLTEASNETAKTGQLTGGLADALNWAGVNEDKFQESLDACTGEQERQALITETLNGLYSEASEKYKTLNKDILEARQATAEMTQATADMGAAFEPVVTAMKQNFADFLQELVPSIELIGSGFAGALNGTAGAAAQMERGFSGLWDTLTAGAQNAVQGIISALPTIAETGLQIVMSIASGLVENAPMILESGVQIIMNLISGITTALPQVIELGAQMLTNIGSGLATGIPNFVNKALELLDGFANMLTENLPKLIESGIAFVTNLAQGLVNAIPDFIAKAPEIISKFANLINDNAPKILAAGVNILITLGKGLISAIPTLIQNIPQIITAIVDVWSAFNWMDLGKKAITFLKDGITSMVGAVKTAGENILNTVKGAIQNLPGNLKTIATNALTDFSGAIRAGATNALNAAKNILDSVLSAFKDAPSKLLQIGKDLIAGLWEGISNMGGWITDQVSGFFGGIVDNVKGFLGIHSPSTVFADIGGNMAAGVGVGFEDNMGSTTSEMQSAIGGAGTLTAQEAINAVNNGIKSNIGQLNGAITAIVQAVMNGLNAQAPQFTTIGQNMAKNISLGFNAGVTFIQNVIPGIVQNIISSFVVQHPKFVNEGRDIDKNIGDGMIKNVTLITGRISQIITPIINAIRGTAQQFRDVGAELVGEIWSGFQSAIPELEANIRDAIKDIISSVKSEVESQFNDMDFSGIGGNAGENMGWGVKNAMRSVEQELERLTKPKPRRTPKGRPGGDGAGGVHVIQNIYANETSYAQQQREAAKQFKLIAREVGL